MLPALGQTLIFVALATAAYSVVATGRAFRVVEPSRGAWLDSAHRATLAVWGALMAAAIVLWSLFLTNDFSVNYVWAHSTRAQPWAYKISALWGGQAGSLLLWAWILAAYGLAVAVSGRRTNNALSPTACAVINVVSVFFIGLVAFAASPFAPVQGATPADGMGLNPLLQNYWMQIHPPTLYVGYVGCTIPFAFAASAMLHRRTDDEWLKTVRRWTLWPWLVLTLGIIMGGAWAYETLGWGGYWAWDPVENASLMPWLTGTAFLHSIMIQARRGMLKTWNMTLVTLTFLLSIFGTFLTRSGVVSSVHSFAESNIGPYFLGFLGVALVLSFGLIIWRRDDLMSETAFESPLSREGAFLLNNWILLGAAFAVLWGTVYPSVSEAVVGQQISVGAPYFNRVMIPLGLVLLALTGIGPLMAWRRTSLRSLGRVLRVPILVALAVAPLLYALGQWHTGAGTAFCLAAFVVLAIGGEFARGARARHSMTGEAHGTALLNLLRKNRQRYGGYIVHLGIVTLFVGAAGNAFKIETEPIEMKPGQTMKVGEYTLRFDGLQKPAVLPREKQEEVAAKMMVERDGQPLRGRDGQPYAMYPTIDVFKSANAGDPEAMAGQAPQTARRPEIMSNLAHDLYLALTGYDPDKGTATVKAYLNPLVMWIWISALFFIGGTMISLWPDRARTAGAIGNQPPSAGRRVASNGQAPAAAPQTAARPAVAASHKMASPETAPRGEVS